MDGKAQPIRFSADMFSFGATQRPPEGDLGFAGFRIHAPLNRPDYLTRSPRFSAPATSVPSAKTRSMGCPRAASPSRRPTRQGRNFPIFRAFWIERPHAGVNPIVISALLDSPSVAGAYRFTVRPGEETVFDVEATFYPRVDIDKVGIAPLTSMF